MLPVPATTPGMRRVAALADPDSAARLQGFVTV
jgi:hypothetical protein